MTKITKHNVLDLEGRKAFHCEMIKQERRARQEAGYKGRALQRMIAQHGGYGAAIRVLRPTRKIADGLVELFAIGRVDLSVEALAVQAPWSELFTAAELAEAYRRLALCDYTVIRAATPIGHPGNGVPFLCCASD